MLVSSVAKQHDETMTNLFAPMLSEYSCALALVFDWMK